MVQIEFVWFVERNFIVVKAMQNGITLNFVTGNAQLKSKLKWVGLAAE